MTTARAIVEEHAAESLLRLIDELPTVPDTLLRIWEIVDDPRSSSETLAEVVRLDVPLTAKLLRLANSPYYAGSTRGLADVKSAVTVLGFETVKQLAICISVATNLVGRKTRRSGGTRFHALWGHSVLVGVIAKRLANDLGDPQIEEVFTAGLLHDLGKFAISVARPDLYVQVLERRRLDTAPLVEVERTMLGFDHALAGGVFGRSWRLPEVLHATARTHHHIFDGAREQTRLASLQAVVALADRLANRLSPPSCDLGFDERYAPIGDLLERLALSADWLADHRAEIVSDMTRARAYLDII
jgi:putative nucleotidyltransferase with HDIG domain